MADPTADVLAFDPGSIRCGWAAFTGGVCTESGTWSVPETWGVDVRLGLLQEWVRCLVRDRKPAAVAVEAGYVRFAKAALVVGEARGIIAATAYMVKADVYRVEPSRAKKAVTNNGRASKAQVLAAVRKLVGREVGGEDEADAVACGFACLAVLRAEEIRAVEEARA